MAITVGSSTITVNSGAVMADPPGTAGLYFTRLWVSFNGTGTISVNGSGGVVSLTDHGVGDYSVNFSTAMSDANYAVCAWNNNAMGTLGSGTTQRCGGLQYEVSKSSSAFRSVVFGYVGSTNTGTAEDVSSIYVSVVR